MSSINVDSEVSGDEVRNLTMSWGYAPIPTTSKPTDRSERRSQVNPVVAAVANFIGNALSMLAGAATTIAFIAWLTGNLTF
jgi:hypothetical protein